MNARMLGLISALLLLAQGCGKQEAAGGWGDMVVPVVAALAQEQPIEEAIASVGTLAADESVDIRSEIDGVIAAINFEEGRPVTQGQVLMALDQTKLQAALAEAQANLKMAESTRARYAALLAARAVAQQDSDKANAAWAANQALVERLQAELEDATIKAPFDGLAGERRLSVGQFISRGTSITTLIDSDPMKLEFRVPERFLGQMQQGQAVKMESVAYPGELFTGKVYFINPHVDEATRALLLKATLPNPDGRLRPGMFANVQLVVKVKARALVIPETALVQQGDATLVFAVNSEDKADMRPIQVGLRMAGQVEVLQGLSAGERVVIEGHQKLSAGMKVSVRAP